MKFENDPIEWKNEGITPSQELQDEGFKAGYKPPAGVFNWFWNRMVRITRELQEKLSGHEVTNSAEHDLMGKEIASKLNESEFTSENILEKIGGTETGMDASTLEGHPASYFATAVHGHSGYANATHNHGVATTSANGFMSTADKIRLDGLVGVPDGLKNGYVETGRLAASVSGLRSTAEGLNNTASGETSHAEGRETIASKYADHAEGYQTTASGNYSHAEGSLSTATAFYSHAEGYVCVASGQASHAEGRETKSGNKGSHAEGYQTTASGNFSHAEGAESVASGEASHAEGSGKIIASGLASHAEGYGSEATTNACHAEGFKTTAEGHSAHAEGNLTNAHGDGSHAGGFMTLANSYQFVTGKCNVDKAGPTSTAHTDGTLFIVGSGTSDTVFKNAFRVDANGNTYAGGTFNANGADYAEMCEWNDGNLNSEERRGLFVILVSSDKIRLATESDDYEEIDGIVSTVDGAVLVGNNDHCWAKMYETDVFNQRIWYEKTKSANTDESGSIFEEVTGMTLKVNPEYDYSLPYVPRTERKEWAAVGMLGQITMVDDGTCVVGKYCKSGAGGVATNSHFRTRAKVLTRFDSTHIRVFFR